VDVRTASKSESMAAPPPVGGGPVAVDAEDGVLTDASSGSVSFRATGLSYATTRGATAAHAGV